MAHFERAKNPNFHNTPGDPKSYSGYTGGRVGAFAEPLRGGITDARRTTV